MLSHDVAIDTDDDLLATRLALLANGASQDVTVRHHFRYVVEKVTGGYDIIEEGSRLATLAGADDVVHLLDERIRLRVSDYLYLGGWLFLDAALATIAGRQVLVVDEPDGNKPTTGHASDARLELLVRLFLDGEAIGGAERVLVRRGLVIAFPAPLKIPARVVERVPDLVPLLAGRPSVGAGATRTWALEPTAAGRGWRLALAPLDALVVLAPGDGLLEIQPLASVNALRAVVSTAVPGSTTKAVAVREVVALLRPCRCYQLIGGGGAAPGEVGAALRTALTM